MKDEIGYARKLQDEYSYQPKEKTNYEKLKELDNKVKKPVNIFSYVFGSVSSLIMGTGMCIAMGVVPGSMPLGILVGLLGIGMVSATYPLHKRILKSRKEKYSNEILKLSNEVIEVSDYKKNKQLNKNDVKTYDSYNSKNATKTNDNYLNR